MKRLLLLYGCFLFATGAAQELPPATEQQLENVGEELLEDDALLQQLAYYRRHPINLNTAGADDLQPLRFLSGLQIRTFLRYRDAFGKLLSLYELQAVPGFDVPTIRKILPYVYAGPATGAKETLRARFKNGESYLLFRWARVLQTSEGYDTTRRTHYLGNRNRLLLAQRFQYKNLLYYGLVADKDAGEQFFKGAQKRGFDFYSVHFFLRNLGKIKALALGDYTVNLGQGLTQWQSLAFGKSVDVMNTKRQSPVLLPYRSSGEFSFNRGAGLTLGIKQWDATVFLSYKKFSGNLVTDSVNRFSSFGTSGYHRTQAEVADRYRLSDFSAGGNLTYSKKALKIGTSVVLHRFSQPMQKSNEPYNYFAFGGKRTVNASLDYSYTYKNAHLFGEAAIDQNLQRSVVQGVMMSLDARVDLSLLYRDIPANYQSLFGNAFTENILPVNEKGLYAGVLLRPSTGWQVAAYADFYRNPFVKYRVSAPGRGWDYLAQIAYIPAKQTEIYLRYRVENKPLNQTASGAVIRYPDDKIKQSLRLHLSSQTPAGIGVKARTELVWYDKSGQESQEGFLVFLEATGQPVKKVKAGIRLQYFETGGFDSRIYAYETDVLYGFSVPAFYDKGFRYYANLNYQLSKRITIWLRIAQTAYPEKSTVGSGLDEIQGGRKTEVKAQIRCFF